MVIFFILLLALGVALLKNGLYSLSPIILVGGLALLLLIFSFFASYNYKLQLSSWQRCFLLITSLFLGLSWVSFLFSQTKTVGYSELLLLTDTVGFLFLGSLWWPELKQKWRDYFFAAVTSLGLINAVVALGQYLLRSETRVAGLFYQPGIIADYYPNAFALSCLLTLPIALYFLLRKESGKVWWTFGLTSVVTIVSALVLSWSRGGWLGGVGIIAFMVVWVLWHKSKKGFLSLALSLILAFVVIAGWQSLRINNELKTNTFISKAKFAGTEAQTSVGERKDFIVRGVVLSWQKPWFGFGPGSFPYIYPSVQTDWLANAPHPHNVLVKIALENGYLALITFVLMLVLLLVKVVGNFRDYPQWSYFVLTALIAAFGHNLIDYNFNFVFNFLLFGVFCGLLVSLKGRDKSFEGKLWWIFIWLILITVVFVLLNLHSLLIQRISLHWPDHNEQKETLDKLQPNLAVNDLYLRLAYFAEEEKNYEKSVEYLKLHLLLNKLDADVWNRLGDNYWLLNKLDEALKAFREALKLDAKNNWSYYFNELNALRVLGDKRSVLARYDEIVNELKSYVPLAEKNIHYTAQSPNLANAIKTADLLLMYKFSPELEEIMLALNLARKTK